MWMHFINQDCGEKVLYTVLHKEVTDEFTKFFQMTYIEHIGLESPL